MHKPQLLACVAATVALSLTLPATHAEAKRKPDRKVEAFATLKAGLKSANFHTRGMAYRGIAFNKKDKELKTLLKDGTQDPQWIVRAGVAQAYMHLKNKAWKKLVHDALIRATLDPREVLPVLNVLKPKDAIGAVVSAIADKEHERQNNIVDGLVALNQDTLGLFVVTALKSKDALVSAAGMRTLKQLNPVLHSRHLGLIAKKLGKKPSVIEVLVTTANKAETTREWAYLKSLKPGKKNAALKQKVAMARARYGDRAVGKQVLAIAAGATGAAQISALEAYKKIATKSDVSALKKLLDGSPDKRLIFSVYEILALVGDRSMSGAAKKLANGTNVDLRPTGVYYLGRVGGAGQLGAMHKYLKDALPEVRLAAARVLAWLASPVSVAPIRESLDYEKDTGIRKALIFALASIKHKSAIQALMFYTRERNAEMRQRVVRALAESGEREARQGLQTALRDRSKQVRVEAVRGFLMSDKANSVRVWKRALGWLPRGTLIAFTAEFKGSFESFLELALFSRRIEMREEALEALALLPKQQPTLLRKVLQSTNNDDLRVRVLNRLVKLEGKKAATEIKSLALSSSARVRVAAIRHMGVLRKDKETRELLERFLNEPNQSVRIAAALTYVGG
ncbi:MAG: HEAT repeat domain-containing protein [Myxococcales bacterium]|nr:HEAT repeat domain-containing protein [Myxococcales bacterium]